MVLVRGTGDLSFKDFKITAVNVDNPKQNPTHQNEAATQ